MIEPTLSPSVPPPRPDPDAGRHEFVRTAAGYAPVLLALGLLCLAAAAAGFFIALKTSVDPLHLQLMTTLPVLAGLALIGRAWLGRNRPVAVTLDDTGVTVLSHDGERTYAWDDIAWNAEGAEPITNVKRCRLYGTDGRVLTSLPAVVDGFDRMVVLINRRIKSRPNAAAEPVRRKRLRRQAVLLLLMGTAFSGALVFMAYQAVEDARHARLLRTSAVEGTATVQRKFVAPDGQTKRIEYRVDAKRPDGTPPDTVNVELEPFLWHTIVEHAKLAVQYVPADPDVSHLVFGQRDTGPDLSTGGTVAVLVAGGVLAVLFLIMGVLNAFGVDLVIDSETKRLRVARGVSR